MNTRKRLNRLLKSDMIHLSIDDFLQTFRKLTENENNYNSVFEEPVFAFLKRMNDMYGATFSCYCFGEDDKSGFSLAEVTRKYKEEFIVNADWLKFGFHAKNNAAVYGDNGGTMVSNRSASEAAEDYEFVIEQLVDIVGGAAIDRVPRIHYFAGAKECCEAWRDAKYGIKGLLAADDDRYSYYHDDEMHDRLLKEGYLYDEESKIGFYRTDIRLEKESDLQKLEEKIRNYTGKCQVIFTHEYYLEDVAMQEKIELCARNAIGADKTYEVSVQELIIKENGKEIYGKLYAPKEEGIYPAVILSHGYNGCNTDFVKECNYYAQNGYIAYSFDFSGGSTKSKSKGSSTDMTIFTEKEDLLTVFNYIKNMGNVDKDNMFLFGGSQGGLVTALAAEECKDEIKGMSLYYPAFMIPDNWRGNFASVDDIPETVDFWGLKLGRNFFASMREFYTFDNIGAFDKNVLIIHGDKDNIVLMSSVTKAEKHYKNAEIVVLEGEGHGFSPQGSKTAMELVLKFMKKQ